MPLTANVLDDFQRADENPLSQGGNWTNFVGIECALVSDAAVAAAGNGIAAYLGTSLFTDMEAWCEFDSWTLHTNDAIYAAARVTLTTGPNNWSGYAALWVYNGVTQQIQLRKIVNNAETILATINPFNMTAGDVIGVKVDGTRIEGWAGPRGAETLQMVATDAAIASGKQGMSILGNFARVATFGGGLPFAPQISREY